METNETPAVVAQQQRVNELKLAFEKQMSDAAEMMKQNQAFLEGKIAARKDDLDAAEKELAQLKLPKASAKADAGSPNSDNAVG